MIYKQNINTIACVRPVHIHLLKLRGGGGGSNFVNPPLAPLDVGGGECFPSSSYQSPTTMPSETVHLAFLSILFIYLFQFSLYRVALSV